ncbi:MAG: lipoate--protein ligase [Clostridia bacterium]|nr:lipoate--protein ligase [Clostridia bacterium]
MIKNLRVYFASSYNPYENLAVEQVLFENTSKDTVIMFLWQNKNTVVIGKNQNPWAECNCALLEKEGGKVARRISGGGAVFHDVGNLNFTFLCHEENYNVEKQLSVIVSACNKAGIEASISGRNDVLALGRKFSGNAFYKKGERCCHHGTILIDADMQKVGRYLTPAKEKLEAKGVKSVGARVVNLNQLAPSLTVDVMKENLIEAFEEIYGIKPDIKPVSTLQDKEAINKYKEKYQDWNYIFGSTIPFSAKCSGQFPWGRVEILIKIEQGKIAEAQVFTDALDETLAQRLEQGLKNCPLKKEAIQNALETFDFAYAPDVIKCFEDVL